MQLGVGMHCILYTQKLEFLDFNVSLSKRSMSFETVLKYWFLWLLHSAIFWHFKV